MILGPTRDQSLYSADELREAGVSKCNIKKLGQRIGDEGTMEAGGERHFAYGSLPKPIRKLLDKAVAAKPGGMLEPVDKAKWLRHQVTKDIALIAEVQAARPDLPKDRIVDVLLGDGWMRLITDRSPQALGFESKPELLKYATLAIQQENLSCLRIRSAEWLRKRITAWKKDGWRSLVSGKIGMVNAKKRTDESDEVLMSLFSDERRFSVAAVWHIYKELRATTNKALPELSETTVREFLDRPEVRTKCLSTRYSNGEWRNELDPVTKRSRPSHPDDLWVLDGTPFELYYQDGKSIRRLYWVWVLDAHSWKVVGYAIGDTETGHLVRQALRMATRTTGTLPNQLQFDNGSAFKAKETLDWMKLMAKATPTAVGNARAKVAEPFWAHFERSILKYYGNHSGGNIKARRLETLANTDFIKENWRSFPDRDGLIRQVHECVALWNASEFNGLVPNKTYAKGSPRRRELTLEQTQQLFWVKRPKTVKYTNRGLCMDVDKVEQWYEAPAGGSPAEVAEFYMDHIGESFTVFYDPDDLSSIALHTAAGKLVALAEAPRLVPMALADMDEQGGADLARRQQIRREVRVLADERSITPDRALEVLKGAITHERLHKDAWNDAEATLKQYAVIGVIEEPRPRGGHLNLAGKATLKRLEIED